MIQAAVGCIARVYLVYQARGTGLWLIPAALGMAFTLLAIPWNALWAIWWELGQEPGPNVEEEMPTEREQALRGPVLESWRG